MRDDRFLADCHRHLRTESNGNQRIRLAGSGGVLSALIISGRKLGPLVRNANLRAAWSERRRSADIDGGGTNRSGSGVFQSGNMTLKHQCRFPGIGKYAEVMKETSAARTSRRGNDETARKKSVKRFRARLLSLDRVSKPKEDNR